MKRAVIGLTVLAWLAVCSVYLYRYVTTRVALPDAYGYEKAWDWQVFFFGLTRLPILIVILVAVLWFEHRLLSKR